MRKYFTKLKNVLYKKDANKCSENIDKQVFLRYNIISRK